MNVTRTGGLILRSLLIGSLFSSFSAAPGHCLEHRAAGAMIEAQRVLSKLCLAQTTEMRVILRSAKREEEVRKLVSTAGGTVSQVDRVGDQVILELRIKPERAEILEKKLWHSEAVFFIERDFSVRI